MHVHVHVCDACIAACDACIAGYNNTPTGSSGTSESISASGHIVYSPLCCLCYYMAHCDVFSAVLLIVV